MNEHEWCEFFVSYVRLWNTLKAICYFCNCNGLETQKNVLKVSVVNMAPYMCQVVQYLQGNHNSIYHCWSGVLLYFNQANVGPLELCKRPLHNSVLKKKKNCSFNNFADPFLWVQINTVAFIVFWINLWLLIQL